MGNSHPRRTRKPRHLHIRGNATVDLEKQGERGQPEPAGVLRHPDPGALAAFLTVVRHRADVDEARHRWRTTDDNHDDTDGM